MKVQINGKTTNFDVKAVSKLTFDKFKEMCEGLSTFKQLVEKKRNAKIKEVYGNIITISKKGRESVETDGQNLHRHNVEPDGRDNRAKQKTTRTRKNIKGKEDKAEIQEQSIRKEKKEDES